MVRVWNSRQVLMGATGSTSEGGRARMTDFMARGEGHFSGYFLAGQKIRDCCFLSSELSGIQAVRGWVPTGYR